MQFSIDPNNLNTFQQKQSWWERFISQPHQIFFSSSIFFALIIMVLTLFVLMGFIASDFSTIHGFGLNYAVFTNAFLGFLITVIPKYNGTLPITSKQYVIPWGIFQISSILVLFGIHSAKFLVAAVMLYFGNIFFNIIKNGKVPNKQDSIFINSIFILGAILLLINTFSTKDLSILTFFGYLLCLVFLVAQRMIPSFYSGYTGIIPWEKPKSIHLVSSVLFISIGFTLQFEYVQLLKITSLLAMLYFGYIVFNLNIYKKVPPILSILTLSFIWLDIGFATLLIESIFESVSLLLSLHIFALGFVLNLLIGFGSRVTMGHAVPQQTIEADKITIFLFIFTQVLVVSRIIASFTFIMNHELYIHFLYLSSVLWIILFALWSARYGKTLFRI